MKHAVGTIGVRRAQGDDAIHVATLVGELLGEIMNVTGTPAFNFDLRQTIARLGDFLAREQYFVFVAIDGDEIVGFVSLYESLALYAEGVFGTIPEFYVRPAYRSAGAGHVLLQAVREFGGRRGWRRLEVTTPPLPAFARTLAFYEREGFTIAGGRKLKLAL